MNGTRLSAVVLLVLAAAWPASADGTFAFGASGAGSPSFAALRQGGAQAVKIVADWSAIESTRGRWAWQDLDAAVAAARREGLQPVVVLAYTPVWASLATGDDARNPLVATRLPPRNLADWERFAGEAVRRYRDTVKDWQVWTVPALPHFRGTASEYLNLLRATRRAAATADRGSRLVVASPPGFDLIHVQRVLAAAPDAVSAISLGPAGLAPEQWLRPLAALRTRVLARTDRPLWLEWAPDRRDPSAALVRAAALARATGVARLFLADGRPLEPAARSLLAGIDPLSFTGFLIREPGVVALVFGAGEGAVLIVWRSDGTATLDVPVLPGARILSPGGGAAVPAPEGQATLQVGPTPVLITGLAPSLVEEARGTIQQRGSVLPVLPPERDFSGAAEVSLRLGRESVERGLTLVRAARNAPLEIVEVNGEPAARVAAGADAAFLYFDIDDSFLFFNDQRFDVLVTVEVFGARAAQSFGFNLFYDARSGYRFTPWQWVEPKDGWVSAAFRLEDANLANTAGWDLAINLGANRREDLLLRSLLVRKVAR